MFLLKDYYFFKWAIAPVLPEAHFQLTELQLQNALQDHLGNPHISTETEQYNKENEIQIFNRKLGISLQIRKIFSIKIHVIRQFISEEIRKKCYVYPGLPCNRSFPSFWSNRFWRLQTQTVRWPKPIGQILILFSCR